MYRISRTNAHPPLLHRKLLRLSLSTVGQAQPEYLAPPTVS